MEAVAEVCAWFKELGAPSRIDVLCGLLRSCVPLEVRLLGSCLEELAKRDFTCLREAELKANDTSELSELTDVFDTVTRSKLNISIALLHASNTACANAICRTLSYVEPALRTMAPQLPILDKTLVDDILLLFTMASNHPAFSYSQRERLYQNLINIRSLFDAQLSNNDIICYETLPKCMKERKGKKVDIINLEMKLPDETSKADSKQKIEIEVTWSNGGQTQVWKTYREMHAFHTGLIELYPNEAGAHRPERSIPFFPPEKKCVPPSGDFNPLQKYISQLMKLPQHVLHCDYVTKFFGPSPLKAAQQIQNNSPLSTDSSSSLESKLNNTQSIDPYVAMSSMQYVQHGQEQATYNDPSLENSGTVNNNRISPTQRIVASSSPSHQPLSSGQMALSSPSIPLPPHIVPPLIGPSLMHQPPHLPPVPPHAFVSGGPHGQVPSSHLSIHPPPYLNTNQKRSPQVSPQSPVNSDCERSILTLETFNPQTWLKQIRLHKYEKDLTNYSFEQLLNLTDQDLEQKGLTAGARKKYAMEIAKLSERFYGPNNGLLSTRMAMPPVPINPTLSTTLPTDMITTSSITSPVLSGHHSMVTSCHSNASSTSSCGSSLRPSTPSSPNSWHTPPSCSSYTPLGVSTQPEYSDQSTRAVSCINSLNSSANSSIYSSPSASPPPNILDQSTDATLTGKDACSSEERSVGYDDKDSEEVDLDEDNTYDEGSDAVYDVGNVFSSDLPINENQFHPSTESGNQSPAAQNNNLIEDGKDNPSEDVVSSSPNSMGHVAESGSTPSPPMQPGVAANHYEPPGTHINPHPIDIKHVPEFLQLPLPQYRPLYHHPQSQHLAEFLFAQKMQMLNMQRIRTPRQPLKNVNIPSSAATPVMHSSKVLASTAGIYDSSIGHAALRRPQMIHGSILGMHGDNPPNTNSMYSVNSVETLKNQLAYMPPAARPSSLVVPSPVASTGVTYTMGTVTTIPSISGMDSGKNGNTNQVTASVLHGVLPNNGYPEYTTFHNGPSKVNMTYSSSLSAPNTPGASPPLQHNQLPVNSTAEHPPCSKDNCTLCGCSSSETITPNLQHNFWHQQTIHHQTHPQPNIAYQTNVALGGFVPVTSNGLVQQQPPTSVPFGVSNHHLPPPPHAQPVPPPSAGHPSHIHHSISLPNGLNPDVIYNHPLPWMPIQQHILNQQHQQHFSHSIGLQPGVHITSAAPPNNNHGQPVKSLMCCNCGAAGHRFLDCKEPSMEMSNSGQYHLNYKPKSDSE